MPHDQQRVRETSEWLSKATRDLASAAALLASDPSLPDTAVFHCQQAAEKSWKAFLAWHGVAFRKTHDLRELGSHCVAIDTSFAPLAQRAEDLTPFAWAFRYPGEPEIPSRTEAEAAFAIATEVYEGVVARIPK